MDHDMNRIQREVLEAARNAHKKAHAPFSRFKVGAAVLASSGRIYSGCNVENSSYGLTICAERVAMFKAISEGERSFSLIAIYTDTNSFTPPCGACRQVVNDLAGDIPVIIMNKSLRTRSYPLKELLPHGFTPHHLQKKK